MDETLTMLDRKWRAACRVVLGREVGSLGDYLPWLSLRPEPPQFHKSSISGKKVTYATPDYPAQARFVGLEEVKFDQRFPPLSINDVKDIDSIMGALGERAAYAGNLVLGNSDHVLESSNVNDLHFAYHCTVLGDSKYLAEVHWGRLNENCFGCHGPGESEFMISCGESFRAKRCFEAWSCHSSSDLYYSHNLQNCSECLFCFNLKNKRNAIGNLELSREKFMEVKKKLVADIADELERQKAVPSLLEIVEKCREEKGAFDYKQEAVAPDYGKSLLAVDREFQKTAKLLFGSSVGNMQQCSEWLQRHTRRIGREKSAASGRELSVVPAVTFSTLPHPQGRLLDIHEAWEHGGRVKLGKGEAEGITLANAHELIGRIAYFVADFREGTNVFVEKCDITIDSANAYHSCSIVYSKYVGYTFWTRNCENAYGCDTLFDSSFCVNCYKSQKLTRCFEMDACRDCADSMFCHNCENVRDSMFCFNAKNLKFAIGNVEMAPEDYRKAKAAILAQVASALGRKHDLAWDIYNIGEKD